MCSTVARMVAWNNSIPRLHSVWTNGPSTVRFVDVFIVANNGHYWLVGGYNFYENMSQASASGFRPTKVAALSLTDL